MQQKIKIESVLIFSSFSISRIAFLCLLRYSRIKKDVLSALRTLQVGAMVHPLFNRLS